jgi:hypothetical protein
MEMEYDLIFISSILIIILICLYVKRSKNKQIEPFRKRKGFRKRVSKRVSKILGNKFGKLGRQLANQAPKCPDCNCPSIQISKTVSSDVQLQKLLDVYVQEGLDKIIQNKKWEIVDIKNGSDANRQLKNSINDLRRIVSRLSDYHTDAENTLNELLDFNDQNVAVIKNDVDETKDIRVAFGAVKMELDSFVSKIKLLDLIIEKMGFHNKFLNNIELMSQ